MGLTRPGSPTYSPKTVVLCFQYKKSSVELCLMAKKSTEWGMGRIVHNLDEVEKRSSGQCLQEFGQMILYDYDSDEDYDEHLIIVRSQ